MIEATDDRRRVARGVREPVQGLASEPVHRLVQAVFATLDTDGVRWALLRGGTRLSARRGDVDLLVDPASLSRLRLLLGEVGMVEVPSPGHGSHAFFTGYDEATDRWVRLDVVTRLAFGRHQELRVLDADVLLAARRWTDVAWELSPSDAFWALLLHHTLDEAPLDAEKWADLHLAAAGGDLSGPVAERVLSVLGSVLTGQLLRTACEGRPDELDAVMTRAADQWRRRAGWLPRVHRTADRLVDRRSRILPGRRGPGLAVAVLGPDGAGKSTLIAALQHQLPWPTRTYYMGVLRTAPLVRRLRKVPGLMLLVRLAVFRGRCALARHHQRRGWVVLFDRYSYDALLPVARSSARGRASARLIVALCPPPDATVVLDCPAEVMFARKGELDLEQLEDFRRCYRAMVERMPDVTVVDATQPADVVRRGVTRLLWQRLYAAGAEAS